MGKETLNLLPNRELAQDTTSANRYRSYDFRY